MHYFVLFLLIGAHVYPQAQKFKTLAECNAAALTAMLNPRNTGAKCEPHDAEA